MILRTITRGASQSISAAVMPSSDLFDMLSATDLLGGFQRSGSLILCCRTQCCKPGCHIQNSQNMQESAPFSISRSDASSRWCRQMWVHRWSQISFKKSLGHPYVSFWPLGLVASSLGHKGPMPWRVRCGIKRWLHHSLNKPPDRVPSPVYMAGGFSYQDTQVSPGR
jgi:hypothetical protein